MSLIEHTVIGLGKYISLFCSSVLRIDPYPFCEFGCRYCFASRATSYRMKLKPDVVVNTFKKIVKILENRGIKNTVFRLSALTDPFINEEREAKASLSIIKICLRSSCKLIINTRGTLLTEEPWIEYLRMLGKAGKVLVQITITHIDDNEVRTLEPSAPSISERFRVVNELAKMGIPVVVRLQPIIPRFNMGVAEDVVRESHRKGAKQIIVEFVKFADISEMEIIRRILDLDREIFEILPDEKQIGIRKDIRREKLLQIQEEAKRLGIEFSTCKEGFICGHTAENCCGMHHMGIYKARRTLEDLLMKTRNKDPFTREELLGLPRSLRRKLIKHEENLENMYRSGEYRKFLINS